MTILSSREDLPHSWEFSHVETWNTLEFSWVSRNCNPMYIIDLLVSPQCVGVSMFCEEVFLSDYQLCKNQGLSYLSYLPTRILKWKFTVFRTAECFQVKSHILSSSFSVLTFSLHLWPSLFILGCHFSFITLKKLKRCCSVFLLARWLAQVTSCGS